MNRWLTLAAVGLWLGAGFPARAVGAEPAPVGEVSVAGTTRIHAYCRARWRDLRRSGRAAGQTAGRFMEQCSARSTPPDAPVGDWVSASATVEPAARRAPVASALLLGALGVVVAAASHSGGNDQPASP